MVEKFSAESNILISFWLNAFQSRRVSPHWHKFVIRPRPCLSSDSGRVLFNDLSLEELARDLKLMDECKPCIKEDYFLPIEEESCSVIVMVLLVTWWSYAICKLFLRKYFSAKKCDTNFATFFLL